MPTKHIIIIRSRDCDDQNYSESETQLRLLELIDPLKSNEFDISIKPIRLAGYNSCFEVVVAHHINHIIQILVPFCAPGQSFYVMSINSSYDD